MNCFERTIKLIFNSDTVRHCAYLKLERPSRSFCHWHQASRNCAQQQKKRDCKRNPRLKHGKMFDNKFTVEMVFFFWNYLGFSSLKQKRKSKDISCFQYIIHSFLMFSSRTVSSSQYFRFKKIYLIFHINATFIFIREISVKSDEVCEEVCVT